MKVGTIFAYRSIKTIQSHVNVAIHEFYSFASRTTLRMVIDDPRNDKELSCQDCLSF